MGELAETDGRALRAIRTREALLQSVIASMATTTSFGGSLRKLALDLGVSHSLLVHHFGSKEQLLGEVIARMRERQLDRMAQMSDLGEFWFETSAPDNLAVYRLFYAIYGQALAEPNRFPDFLEHVVTDWVSTLVAHLRDHHGITDIEQATVWATTIIAHTRGLLLDLLTTGDRPRVDAAFRHFTGTIQPMLRPAEMTSETAKTRTM